MSQQERERMGMGLEDRVAADNVGCMLQRERELMDDDFV